MFKYNLKLRNMNITIIFVLSHHLKFQIRRLNDDRVLKSQTRLLIKSFILVICILIILSRKSKVGFLLI